MHVNNWPQNEQYFDSARGAGKKRPRASLSQVTSVTSETAAAKHKAGIITQKKLALQQ
jgi:hypothetical protein